MPKTKGGSIGEAIGKRALSCLGEGDKAPKVSLLLKGLTNRLGKTTREKTKLLSLARRWLEREHDICVCSVGELFYSVERGPNKKTIRQSFLKQPPESEEDARKCLPGGKLPGGKPNKTAGLYFAGTKQNDLIYEVFTLRYARQGMRETSLNIGRIERGVEQKVLDQSSTPRKLGNLWADYFAERLAPAFQRQIDKAINKRLLSLGVRAGFRRKKGIPSKKESKK